MPFISFEDVEQLATIEELADMLGLQTNRHGNSGQVRCACPIHGGDKDTLAISPGVRSKRGSLGVFFCQKSKSGGDRIGLVAHCMDFKGDTPQQDAAFFIQSQFGTGTVESTVNSDSTVSKNRATVPQKPEGRSQPASPSKEAPAAPKKKEVDFDPVSFAAKLVFTEEVAALGYTEADAECFSIGLYRGLVYRPVRYPSGCIAGFEGRDPKTGEVKLPKTWLPDTAPSNVVKLKRA